MCVTVKLQFSRQWRVCLYLPFVLVLFCPSRQMAAKQHRAVILLSATQAIYHRTLETNNKHCCTHEIWLLLQSQILKWSSAHSSCKWLLPVCLLHLSTNQNAEVAFLPASCPKYMHVCAFSLQSMWIRDITVQVQSLWLGNIISQNAAFQSHGEAITYICTFGHASSSQTIIILRHSQTHLPPSGGSWVWWRWFASKSTKTWWKWHGIPVGTQLKAHKHKEVIIIYYLWCTVIYNLQLNNIGVIQCILCVFTSNWKKKTKFTVRSGNSALRWTWLRDWKFCVAVHIQYVITRMRFMCYIFFTLHDNNKRISMLTCSQSQCQHADV